MGLSEARDVVFPELIYIDRLERLNKIYDHSKLNKEILLAVLLIDEKDNHEYFIHKYNVSNKIKEKLIRFALDLVELYQEWPLSEICVSTILQFIPDVKDTAIEMGNTENSEE